MHARVVYCAPRSHQYIPSPLDVECREAERLESRHEVVAYVRREITQHSPSNAAQSRRGRSTCEGEAAGLGHRSATKNNVPSANATYTSWIFLSSPVLPIGLTNAQVQTRVCSNSQKKKPDWTRVRGETIFPWRRPPRRRLPDSALDRPQGPAFTFMPRRLSCFARFGCAIQLSWVSASHRDKAQDAFIYVRHRPAGPILSYIRPLVLPVFGKIGRLIQV